MTTLSVVLLCMKILKKLQSDIYSPAAFTCQSSKVKCKNEDFCFKKHFMCDTWKDCKDGWDEGSDNCGEFSHPHP